MKTWGSGQPKPMAPRVSPFAAWRGSEALELQPGLLDLGEQLGVAGPDFVG